MEHIKFGGTGLRVSRLCIGTMTFGLQCDEAQSHDILDAAAAGGIDFLDTSDVYPLGGDKASKGRTEEIVGNWLKGKRNQFIVATKCAGSTGPKPWDQGTSRKHMLEAVDASLRRLGTDYIDLYQLHRYDPLTPLDEVLEAFDTIIRSGKARYAGVSNWPAHKIARALGRSEVRNLARINAVQPRYNLLFRNHERDMLPMCQEEGLAVIPYNPLAGGVLTGKHVANEPPPEGSRFMLGNAAERYQKRYWHERQFQTVEELRAVSKQAGMAMVTMALSWVMANPAITAPIIGASRPQQLADNLAAAERGPLPADIKKQLDDITHAWRAVDEPR